ncbi:hypothetical protein PVAND_010826 [Polypedilum vanderplanki]|uniref:PHD-type domain-containing protein n=1 Tax=Polypedilum vanderplanki TaxID=319348 RepID=A0A9J6CHP2_POLVA|nr:hypothetical protein PVAND_010826 [Polypedilum vanderplanki]
MANLSINTDQFNTHDNLEMTPKSPPITVSSSDNLCSPKSTDSKKSPSDSTNRRKRKPKKVSNVESNQSDIDLEAAEISQNNPAINALILKETKTDSDDCETIDKIAQMVSNFTSSTSPHRSSSSLVLDLTKPQPTNINEVENRLEEMFSDQNSILPTKIITATHENAVIQNSDTKVEAEQQQKPKPKTRKRKKPQSDANGNKKQKKNAVINGKSNKAGSSKKVSKDEIDQKKGQKKSKENSGKTKVKVDVAPYLQIQKDGTFNIINQIVNGEDDGEKLASKSKKSVISEKNKGIRGGLHVRSLVNKNDSEKKDTNWICVFCKLSPHKHKLGDLFGPYIVSKQSKEYSFCLEDPMNDIFRQSNSNKFMPVSPSSNKKKRKNSESPRKLASPTFDVSAVAGPETREEVFAGMTQIDENNYEVWFHEDCIVWSPGTHIINSKIVGLEQAVWQSTRYRCAYCQKNGAMISCLIRGCKKEAHVVCARKNWKLCDDFKTYCEQHSN